jgi:hypothetical protein
MARRIENIADLSSRIGFTVVAANGAWHVLARCY